MTTIERYKEMEIRLQKWEAACYWCGRIFKKDHKKAWREHVNVEQETKIFCCPDHRNTWIYYKQALGELMP